MAYGTSDDERRSHRPDVDGAAMCGARALPYPDARPLLFADDAGRATCAACATMTERDELARVISRAFIGEKQSRELWAMRRHGRMAMDKYLAAADAVIAWGKGEQ